MTFTMLGLGVEFSDVQQATPALQKLTAAATGAETAARSLAGGSQAAAGGARALDAASEAAAASTTRAAGASRVYTAALQAESAALRMANMQRTNLIFQLNDIGVSLASGMNPLMVAIQQGSQIATIYGAGEGGIGRALKETGNIAVGFVTKFWPIAAAVGVVGVAVGALTTEINKNQQTQVSWTDVVSASWQLAGERIKRFIQPALDVIGGWWNAVAPFVVSGVNSLIGVFDLAFRDVETIWNMLPAALGDVVFTAAQNTVDGITWMVREAVSAINGMIAGVNGLLSQAGLPTIGNLGNPNEIVPDVEVPNPFGGADKAFTRQMAQNRVDVAGTDYIGAIGDRAVQIRETADAADAAADSLKAANDNGRAFEQMLSDVEPLLHDANDPLRDLQSNMDKLGALLAAGEISWEQYGNAVSKANLNAASGVLGAVGQITGALAGAFENNKAFAVANAVINTAEGVTKALAQGGIFGFASAAAIGISGAAQIASILSAKPGSGSTAPVSGASAAAAQNPAVSSGAQQAATVVLRGQFFSAESVADLLKNLIKDGGAPGLVTVIHEAA
jgi:hypothetical protein